MKAEFMGTRKLFAAGGKYKTVAVSIPKQARDKLGLKEGDWVEIYLEGDKILLRKRAT